MDHFRVIIRYLEGRHVHLSRRQIYFLSAAATAAFLVVNVWVALDHLRIQRRTDKETFSSLEGTKLLAEQRSALLAARPDDGPIDLQSMRNAGIRVPESFIHGGHFASPWGRSQIKKEGDQLVWDFHEITITGCLQLLATAIPGVLRAAASGGAADEKPAPLAREVAIRECRRTPLMARLIVK